jgi:hypothetical protein
VFVELPEFDRFLNHCKENKIHFEPIKDKSIGDDNKPDSINRYSVCFHFPKENKEDAVDNNNFGYLEWIVARDPLNDFRVSYEGSLSDV